MEYLNMQEENMSIKIRDDFTLEIIDKKTKNTIKLSPEVSMKFLMASSVIYNGLVSTFGQTIKPNKDWR